MLNILLTGVGGQGTVLAAKVLAQTAQDKGWEVRTAETIGMAQRGGSVISHVRIGNEGEEVYSPLLAQKTADLIIAFEPAEAVRVLPYLSQTGLLVSATDAIQPVSATLSKTPYRAQDMLTYLEERLGAKRFIAVEGKKACEKLGSTRVLNMILLAAAVSNSDLGISVADIEKALSATVKEKFVALNLEAVNLVARSCSQGE